MKNGKLEEHEDFQRDFPELIKITRETHLHLKDVKQGISKLLQSQIDVVALLEELKPLRSLPDISNNLNKIVDRLIEPATRNRRDWPSLILVVVLSALVVVMSLKDSDFKGALKWLGSEATLESHPEKNLQ